MSEQKLVMQPPDLRALRQLAVQAARRTEPASDDFELAKAKAEAVIKLVDELLRTATKSASPTS